MLVKHENESDLHMSASQVSSVVPLKAQTRQRMHPANVQRQHVVHVCGQPLHARTNLTSMVQPKSLEPVCGPEVFEVADLSMTNRSKGTSLPRDLRDEQP